MALARAADVDQAHTHHHAETRDECRQICYCFQLLRLQIYLTLDSEPVVHAQLKGTELDVLCAPLAILGPPLKRTFVRINSNLG